MTQPNPIRRAELGHFTLPESQRERDLKTGFEPKRGDFPTRTELIGFDRVLATIPGLVSRRFEGGLYPIELANGIASLSSYPSARILQRFLDSATG